MAKTFKVLKITPSTSQEPGTITIEGDWAQAFTGAFYLDEETNTHHPLYEDQPADTRRIDATAFRLIGNDRFGGRYSVRTPRDDTPEEKDRFLDEDGNTVLRVNELIKPLGDSEDPAPLTQGTVTNITTFIIDTPDVKLFIYPKSISKVLYLDLPGHGFENWGEIYTQNMVDIMFNHATTEEPRSAKTGQLWFDLELKQLKIWAGDRWIATTPAPPKPVSYFHTQEDEDSAWIVQHDLEVPFPHIAAVQVYADRGYGPEPIAPKSISFSNRNQISITFSEPVKGWAKILS